VHDLARRAIRPYLLPSPDKSKPTMTAPHLTPEMIEELDDFFPSDGAPADSRGILDPDGLLTGIVVGPELIMPSEWISPENDLVSPTVAWWYDCREP